MDVPNEPFHLESGLTPADSWQVQMFQRHLKALQSARTIPDRIVLVRELARFNHGTYSWRAETELIPRASWLLAREYGLTVRVVPDGQVIGRWAPPERDGELPEGTAAALQLDTTLRRTSDPVEADTVLTALTPFPHYQNATQKAAVRAALTMPDGGALLVSMPTGAGKSLVFEIAQAYWRSTATDERPTGLLVVPTVSLAMAHEHTMRGWPGLEGSRALYGDLSQGERRLIEEGFVKGEIPLLIVAPEILFGRSGAWIVDSARERANRPIAAAGRLTAVFVDEAHIIESWGRTFRPDFQRLPGFVARLRQSNPALKVILLSATISKEARQLLKAAYGQAPEWLEVDASVPRTEFDLVGRQYPSLEQRDAAVAKLVRLAPRPAVVYTTLVDEAEQLYERIRHDGHERVALMTGDRTRPTGTRRELVERWLADDYDLVVATSAFGMGIDKPDVRTVIHACIPEGSARLYQEIGRGGRDGHQALAATLYWCNKSGWSATGERIPDDESVAYGLRKGELLTVQRASERWDALLQQSHITWEGQRARVALELDAHPTDLAEPTGEQNRNWNRSLLNLLQRASALQVMDVVAEQGPAMWTAFVNDLDLLDSDTAKRSGRLQHHLKLRDVEIVQIRREVGRLLEILRNSSGACWLEGLFAEVEGIAGVVEVCGRCPWCRNSGLSPECVPRFQGTSSVWPDGGISGFPFSTRQVILPEDPTFGTSLGRLVERLWSVGIDHFCASTEVSGRVRGYLRDRGNAGLGLITALPEIATGEWKCPSVPTAVLLPAVPLEIGLLWDSVRKWSTPAGKQLLVVATSAHTVGGRRVVDIASIQGALREDVLDDLAFRRSVK
jgi:ATP-dependent DNA helicase RecQ